MTLDRNKHLVVKYDVGPPYTTSVQVGQTTNLEKAIKDAIQEASDVASLSVTGSKKQAELNAMNVSSQVSFIQGLLNAAPTKMTTPPTKTMPMPGQAPARESAAPAFGRVDDKWLTKRLAEAEGGKRESVGEIYGKKGELDKQVEFQGNSDATTRIVFAALWKIQVFRQCLRSSAQEGVVPSFSRLSGQVDDVYGLTVAGRETISEANKYIRYFLLELMPQDKQYAHYAWELRQLPGCKRDMERLLRSPQDMEQVAGPMNSETVIAAALWISRWNLSHRLNTPENKVQLWQTPETMNAVKKAIAYRAQPDPANFRVNLSVAR